MNDDISDALDSPHKTILSSPAVMLLGQPGSGKTFSLGTLAKRRKLVYLYTDPGGDESLLESLEYYKVPISQVHWHYVAPASQSWDAMTTLAEKINMMDYASLAGIKSGIDKREHRQLYEIISILSDFPCQRTGARLGPVDHLPPDEYAFAFDSISGLNQICKEAAVGAKPTLHEGEWGVAMAALEMLIRKIVASVKCPRVLIGHTEMYTDQVLGRTLFTVALLGKKLAASGVVVRNFSDVIFAYREGGKFQWSTDDDRIALKTRNLEIAEKLPPSFEPIIDRWERRVARASENK